MLKLDQTVSLKLVLSIYYYSLIIHETKPLIRSVLNLSFKTVIRS